MKPEARAQLMAVLADAGIQPEDYRDIERARRIVDRVNARLTSRGAVLMYALMTVSAASFRSPWPSSQAPEDDSAEHPPSPAGVAPVPAP